MSEPIIKWDPVPAPVDLPPNTMLVPKWLKDAIEGATS